MRNLAVLALIAPLLSGCMTAAAYVNHRIETFVPANYAWSRKPGRGTISGRPTFASGRSNMFCAEGASAWLMPSGPYTQAKQRMGKREAYGRQFFAPFLPDEAQYLFRTTTCDASGAFRFEDVPAGTFYVYVSVLGNVHAPTEPVFPYTRVRMEHQAVTVSCRVICDGLRVDR